MWLISTIPGRRCNQLFCFISLIGRGIYQGRAFKLYPLGVEPLLAANGV